MTIAYLPNDPTAPAPLRQIKPSPDRPAGRAGFKVAKLPPEQVYPVDGPDYVAWGAREAALRAVAAFEDCAGPLVGWQGKAALKSLALIPDAGQQLNAYYDRASISFFDAVAAGKTIYSGASTDVVSHETGHAILDALRPDLWNTSLTEVAAFHEGFGDCIALLTALSDKPIREALVKADPKMEKPNFVEAIAEALSAAIAAVYGPRHSAAKPRHALNDYRWDFPQNLPADGPPGVLINEVHSLGQLLSGTYYRIIQGVFARTKGGEAGLWEATRVATWLLATAVAKAPVKARFFQSVGRTMLIVDQAGYKGSNIPAIRAAYAHHNIDVGASTFLSPQMPLGPVASGFAAAGSNPLRAGGKASLAVLLGAAADAKVSFTRIEFGDRIVSRASVAKAVDLSGLDPRLANAVAVTPQQAFVGPSGDEGGAAMLGAADSAPAIDAEVRSFVETLLRRDDIAFEPGAKGGGGFVATKDSKTHALKGAKGEPVVLERIAFACGCCREKSRP